MLSLAFALVVQAAAAPTPGRAADRVPRLNCDMPWQAALNVTPHGPGPLRPLSLDCHNGRIGGRGSLASPDGRRIAALSDSQSEGILRLFDAAGGDAPVSYDTGVGVFLTFVGIQSPPPVAWSADSRFVWAVRQTRLRPRGGWALTPLRPVRVHPDGRAEDLPELRHSAGGLDGLLWIGGDGLALAHFGTRGGLYRPEHPDPDPTFAIVDAARGRILESLPIARLWPLAGIVDREPSIYGFRQVLPVQLPDGRLRVLFVTHRNWILWTQGETPRRLANTPDLSLSPHVVFDGRHVLVMRPFQPTPGETEIVITSCRVPGNCPIQLRQLRERTWAALYDVRSERLLWQLRRNADARDMPWAPSAISPDGRYALMSLEPDAAGNRDAALVSMRDGRILQTIPATYNQHLLGFARGGREAWLDAGSYTAVYEVR